MIYQFELEENARDGSKAINVLKVKATHELARPGKGKTKLVLLSPNSSNVVRKMTSSFSF